MKTILSILIVLSLFVVGGSQAEEYLLQGNLGKDHHVGVPVLDVEKAKTWYTNNLGFNLVHETSLPTAEGDIKVAFVRLNDLTIELYQLVGKDAEEVATRRDGHIDHIAFDVVDMEKGLKDVLAKGGKLHETTSDGPVLLPTFYSKGVTYVKFRGLSGGETIELTLQMDLDPARRSENLGGWSHLGIPATNIENSKNFYRQFGFKETMRADIAVGNQMIPAAMMTKDGFTLEFYQLLGADLKEVASRKDGCIDHIALQVADVDKAYADVKAAGLAPLEDAPVLLKTFFEKGVKYFNVRGPDGEKVEFIQVL